MKRSSLLLAIMIGGLLQSQAFAAGGKSAPLLPQLRIDDEFIGEAGKKFLHAEFKVDERDCTCERTHLKTGGKETCDYKFGDFDLVRNAQLFGGKKSISAVTEYGAIVAYEDQPITSSYEASVGLRRSKDRIEVIHTNTSGPVAKELFRDSVSRERSADNAKGLLRDSRTESIIIGGIEGYRKTTALSLQVVDNETLIIKVVETLKGADLLTKAQKKTLDAAVASVESDSNLDFLLGFVERPNSDFENTPDDSPSPSTERAVQCKATRK